MASEARPDAAELRVETEAEPMATRYLLAELYDWAVDAAHQGAGTPMTDPHWHMHMSTWEEADELLPRVAAFLGRPDPRGAERAAAEHEAGR